MKITRLKDNQGKKLSEEMIDKLSAQLQLRLAQAGYITDVCIDDKIGLHMKQFIIDTDILPKNIRENSFNNTLTGWTYTNIPTWEQRVEFNNIINEFFDANNLTARIISGVFLVRCQIEGPKNESNWYIDDRSNPWQQDIRQSTQSDHEYWRQCKRDRAKELRQKKKEIESEKKFELKLVVSN